MPEQVVETNVISVPPGKTDSFHHRWLTPVQLKNFVTHPGLEIQKVIVGKESMSFEGGSSVEISRSLEPKQFVIVLVKNVTKELVSAPGHWTVFGEKLGEVKKGPPATVPSITTKAIRKGGRGGVPMPAKSEVVILLHVGLAQRLLGVIQGKNVVTRPERGPYERALKNALARYRGQEVEEGAEEGARPVEGGGVTGTVVQGGRGRAEVPSTSAEGSRVAQVAQGGAGEVGVPPIAFIAESEPSTDYRLAQITAELNKVGRNMADLASAMGGLQSQITDLRQRAALPMSPPADLEPIIEPGGRPVPDFNHHEPEETDNA